ncbi:MAG TPA: FtsX-like permease family protein, partial [Ktedonobacterales bacterium]
ANLLLTAFVGSLAAAIGLLLMLRYAPDLFLRFVATPAEQSAGVTSGYLVSQVDVLALIEPAVACVLVAVVMSGWTALTALRSNVRAMALEAASEGRQPFWQRLKLDVLLAFLCVGGYLDLAYYHGEDALPSAVKGAPSPLLVAAPLMLLVAATLLLLRMFPLVAKLWARLASRGRGATGLLASMRLTRGQSQAALQPLLLMLAIGVLTLTVTYQVSAQQVAAAQSAYQAGADLRLVERTTETPEGDAQIRARLATLPGLASATSAYRGVSHSTAYWNVVSAAQDAVDTLAIDPQTFANVTGATSWRPSYAKMPLADLMEMMASHERQSAASDAPVGTEANPIWAIVSQRFAQSHDRKLGQTVKLLLPDNIAQMSYFTVGAIVSDFPTMHAPGASGVFMVTDEHSLFTAVGMQNEKRNVSPGPNEYWLRGGGALASAVEGRIGPLDVDKLFARQQMEADLLTAPSLVGVQTLMLLGAAAICLLTVLAVAMQTALDGQQRGPELQAMRALGVSKGQLDASLISERLFIALFGVGGGALTGWTLSTTTLPYLPMPGAAVGALPGLSVALLVPLVAAVGVLVGVLVLYGVVMSLRETRRPINRRLLDAEM